MLIHVVADFGAADLAFAEVTQRLKRLLPRAEVLVTSVPPFATLAAGFCAAQLALNDAPRDTMVFHNVAPRRDDRAGRPDNAGEAFACLILPSGVRVVGANAGHAFSFLKHHAVDFRVVNVDNAGTQFRSRDNYPDGIARVLNGEPHALGEPVPLERVPEVPEAAVAYVDGFGNIKTTITGLAEFPLGSTVNVTINGVTRSVTLAAAGFALPEGELVLAPGSSGWKDPSGEQLRFRELFLRGGSAFREFGEPPNGAEITLTAAGA
ncbi:MAG TPA: SAM hydroxide adenosyltransferase [Deinococcales bacterium]|nr:SAM hydroxide adenosyltransferase [Deinococcales bacterium]